MKKFLTCLAVLGLLSGPALTPAQADETEEAEARSTETVIVTAGRIAETPKSVTQSVLLIDSEQIERSQHKDLSDVLAQNGVQITKYNAGSQLPPRITLRGMSSNLTTQSPLAANVLVLVDGMRLATYNIDMIPMSSIERVEILRGPAAVQYGTSAMGGVVNVITRRGQDKPHIYAEIGGGSWEGSREVLGAGGKFKGLDIAGGITHSAQTGDYYDGKHHDVNNSAFDSSTAYNLNAGYTIGEHRLGIWGLGARKDGVGMPNASYSPAPRDYADNEAYAYAALYEGGYKDAGLSWMARYFSSMYKDTSYNFAPPAWSDSSAVNELRNQGVQAQVTWKHDWLTLTGGLDWTEDKYWSGAQPEIKSQNTAPFLLAKASFWEDMLVLSGGFRYDTYNLSFNGHDKDYHKSTFSGGIAFSPLKWLTFKGNIGQSYRIPNGMEVAGYTGGWAPYIGNPDLEPEKGLGYDFGVEVNWRTFRASLTYFATDYTDKIGTESLPGGKYRYINLDGTTYYRGLEGSMSVDVADFFDWPFMLRPYVNFTHLTQCEGPDGERLQYLSDWEAGFGLNFSHPEWGLDADLSFTYYGEQRQSDWSPTGNGKEIETGNVVITDLTVTKTLWDWDDYGKLSVRGELRNLFDKDYELMNGYRMPGRSFFLSLIYKY